MPRLRAASKSSPCISGRSLHLNSSPSPDTPRSNRSGPLPSDQMHRHGVEYLIGKYQSAELLGKMLQPGYPGREMWREPFE